MSARHRIGLLALVSAIVWGGCSDVAVARDAIPKCLGVAPICHLGQTAECLCATPSQGSCAWRCVYLGRSEP